MMKYVQCMFHRTLFNFKGSDYDQKIFNFLFSPLYKTAILAGSQVLAACLPVFNRDIAFVWFSWLQHNFLFIYIFLFSLPTHLYIYAHTCICIYVHTCIYVNVHTNTHTHISIYIFLYSIPDTLEKATLTHMLTHLCLSYYYHNCYL